jgi:polyhydroxyalkanoate synthesis regulator phasin
MAVKLPEIFSRTDAKSRLMIVVGTVVGVVVLIYLGSRFLGGATASTGKASVASAPSSLQSVPGGQLTPEYSRALAQENAQAVQKAQMSGGSSVATLVNDSSSQPVSTGSNTNCTVVCPGADDADVTQDINTLVKEGKLSQTEANTLLSMAKENVPVSEYAAQLDQLVKAGKLTPEQARKLLETYTKQHANALITESSQSMDSLIKSGKLPLAVASQLLDLQKQHLSAAQYSDALQELVREGKISPDTAATLLAQYTQQQAKEAAKEGGAALQEMVRSGEITAEVATDLQNLQKKNVPVAEYEAELNKLVAEGKMTPAAAAKLLAQYKTQRESMGAASAANDMVAAADSDLNNSVKDLVASGKITQATADTLADLQKRNVSPAEYQKALAQLVKEGKLSPEDAKKLMQKYQKLNGLKSEAEKLAKMQSNNASAADYTAELKRAVAAGILTPEQAAELQRQYNAQNAYVPRGGAASAGAAGGAGAAGTAGANGSNFSRLQERLKEQQAEQQAQESSFAGPAAPGAAAAGAAPGTTAADQFSDAEAKAAADAAAAAELARQQRIKELQAAMAGQAHSLLTAWQAPVMQHKAGSADLGGKSGSGSSGGLGGLLGRSSSKTTTTTTDDSMPIIKAGSILYATLDTAVNSDFPDTPVLATIITGPFKGAKLLGKISVASNPVTQSADRVSLVFNLMDKDEWSNTKAINAFAIDPQTAHTVLASSVDYHYLLRYGSMLGSAFMAGYANAISQSSSTSTTGIFGTSTTHPELSPGNKLAVGLGQVGTTLGTATSNYINTPPTVKINAGVGLGILFMANVGAAPGPTIVG